MTGLLELAERCEAATGPDRGLDAEIAAVLRIGTEHKWAYSYPSWIAAADGRVHLEKNGPSFAASAYTASLDAAMTIVPTDEDEAMNIMVLRDDNEWEGAVWSSFETQPSGTFATTPALALVAAALRARDAI